MTDFRCTKCGGIHAGTMCAPRTLRDDFAAAALAGIVQGRYKGDSFKPYATDAYHFADAMLAERDKA